MEDDITEDNIMECKQASNLETCTCGAESCLRHGICCECLRHHMAHRQFPRCVFPADVELRNRSFETFAEMVISGQV
jgi:hypothetical protein